jgi:hypothetical protein
MGYSYTCCSHVLAERTMVLCVFVGDLDME